MRNGQSCRLLVFLRGGSRLEDPVCARMHIRRRPQGGIPAVGEATPDVRLWDWATGKEQPSIRLPVPRNVITALAFSPDGRRLAAGCGFGGLNLHIVELAAHSGAFAPGQGLVTKVWTTGLWREVSLQGVNLKDPRELDASPDERTIALGYDDGTAAWWDIATRKRLALFDGHHIGFSPDGNTLFANSAEGTALIWRAPSWDGDREEGRSKSEI
jgi:WD40 repeat protein